MAKPTTDRYTPEVIHKNISASRDSGSRHQISMRRGILGVFGETQHHLADDEVTIDGLGGVASGSRARGGRVSAQMRMSTQAARQFLRVEVFRHEVVLSGGR